MKLYIINFEKQLQYGENLIGFQIFNEKQTNKHMKIIKLLEQNNISFMFNNQEYLYNTQDFSFQKITLGESKALNNVFDMNLDNGFSRTVGFFPNVYEDAINGNIIEDLDSIPSEEC